MYVHKHMSLFYICAALRLSFTITLVHSLKLPVEEDECFNFQVLALECAGVYGMGTMMRHLIWKPLFPSWQHFTQSNNTACFKVFISTPDDWNDIYTQFILLLPITY